MRVESHHHRDVIFKEHIFPFAKPFSTVKVPLTVHNRGSDVSSHDLESLHIPEPHTRATDKQESDMLPANNEIPGIEDVAISKESGTDETLVEPIDDDRGTPVGEISGEAEVHNVGRQSLQPGSVEVRRFDRNIKEPLWHQDYVITKKANGTVLYYLSDYLSNDTLIELRTTQKLLRIKY